MSVCKVKAGGLVFELDVKGERDLFEQIAHIQEVFDHVCGKCDSSNIKLVVRENDGNKFYEMRCKDCGAKLSFGSHKTGGTLFPKRKGDGDEWLPSGGWTKWDASQNKAV